MINSVKITNYLNESITLDLKNPDSSGFLIRGIDGLGPVKANIEVLGTESNVISSYNYANVGSRNIVMGLQFLPNPTIAKTRANTYKYFPIKRLLTIEITTDVRTYRTQGYVESNEPGLFSGNEMTIISILCPSSYFYSTNTMSNSSATSPITIAYPSESGEAPVGMLMDFTVSGVLTYPKIYASSNLTGSVLSIDSALVEGIVGSAIASGDHILISTVRGDLYAKLKRGSTYYTISTTVTRDSVWFQLDRGYNTFSYTQTGSGTMSISVENYIAYEGI